MDSDNQWNHYARCRGLGDIMFPEDGKGTSAAQDVCFGLEGEEPVSHCPVISQCLALALTSSVGQHGIWGGLSERTRRTLVLKYGSEPARVVPPALEKSHYEYERRLRAFEIRERKRAQAAQGQAIEADNVDDGPDDDPGEAHPLFGGDAGERPGPSPEHHPPLRAMPGGLL